MLGARSRLRPYIAVLGLGLAPACASGPGPSGAAGSDGPRRPGEESTAASPEPAASTSPLTAELPAAVSGELRERGSDADGRLLTLSSVFIAVAACSDCGAPSYQRVVAISCADEHHCELLTEGCQGTVARESRGGLEVVAVELRAVDGDTADCAAYSGLFEAPQP